MKNRMMCIPSTSKSISVSLIWLSLFCFDVSNAAEPISRHLDGVLGTSLDFSVYGVTEQAAQDAFDVAENEISRLEQLLSNWRNDSELMLLNSSLTSANASTELLDIVRLCSKFNELSDGKFSCRLGKLIALWDQAEKTQVLPIRQDVRHIARAAATGSVIANSELSTIVLDSGISLDVSGLAKGYIIDSVLSVLKRELPLATGIKVDIGGDAIYWGVPNEQNTWQVAVADPINISDNSRFLARLSLQSMAVAASGHTSRTRKIERRSFSHILNPRDGWPIENGTASIVLAQDAVSADAIATALTVLPLNDGVDWINTLDGVEALLIDSAGRQMHSANWTHYIATSTEEAMPSSAPLLELRFTLPTFNTAGYNRPYLAVWITDTEQKPIKHLLLLGESERWARENARWWRRVGRRNPELLDGVARPTRGPGEYHLEWDGIDDFGLPVALGEYLFHIEASRENGGSTYHKLSFRLGSASTQELEQEGELGSILLRSK